MTEPVLQPSDENKYPTPEQPLNRYKFVSLDIFLDKELKVVNRSTYSLLEWLGDWGGLLDGLLLLGKVFVKPVSALALKAKIASALVSV